MQRNGVVKPGRRRVRLGLVVAIAALVAAACTPWSATVPRGAAPLRYRDLVFASVTTTTGIVYGNAPDAVSGTPVDLALDLREPAGDTAPARPAIVWVHGGSFSTGSRTSAELVDQGTVFARKGYVNASISYRLTPGGCSAANPTESCVQAIERAQHDAQAAVRFLRANAATYRIDPERIAIAGTSAGAITAVNVGFNPDDPGSSGNPGHSSAVRAAVSFSGAKARGVPNPGEAALLMFHGTADVIVPYFWAELTYDEARGVVPTNLITWEGDGHVPYVAHRDEIIERTTNFLYWALTLELVNPPPG
jgi:acetyl esterase/lipase